MAEDIQVPSLGESITEATVGQWLKKAGDAVQEDEAIVELETDKVAVEVTAPVAGVLSEILSDEGETVEVGHVIARFDAGAKAQAAAKANRASPAPADEEEVEAAPAQRDGASGSSSAVRPMSPAVRRLIADHDLDAAGIEGTGKNSRITKTDVMKAIGDGSARKPASRAADAAPVPRAVREERVPMSRMRKRIAERLKEAQNTAAMLTTYNEVDMSAVISARAKYKDLFERKHGIKLGFMSFFVQAAVQALREVPAVNAEIQGDEIVYKNYYNIGVAVSAPNGLVVPVVQDADQLSFADTEKAIVDFGRRARDGKLGIEDMQGGTFTISNGGVFGSLMSSPILNPPQPGILGMHKIEKRPVVENDEIVIRPMMYLALSYDHRIIDGREAVTFLVRIKECIEDPGRLLLDL